METAAFEQIKMFVALPRRPDVSEAFFHDHWRHPHGTMGLTIPATRHYVQNHRVVTPLLGASQHIYDGVCEVWFANAEEAANLPSNPDYLRLLREDEPRFIDMSRIKFVFTKQTVIYSMMDARMPEQAWEETDRPFSAKLLQLFPAGHPALGSDDDGSAGRAMGAFKQAICRPDRVIHPDNAPFAEIREYWWPTVSAFEEAASGCSAAVRDPDGTVSVFAIAERYR